MATEVYPKNFLLQYMRPGLELCMKIGTLAVAIAGNEQEQAPVTSLGTSTPVAATIFLMCSSTMDRFTEGLGQSDPFMDAGFQTPRVTSAEK